MWITLTMPHFIVYEYSHSQNIKKIYTNVDSVDNLLGQEIFSDFYYVSSTHGYQQIACG